MSKDYSKGYKQGQQDGANGDNNLAMQSFKRLFTEVGSWLPGADNRGDQFRAGYLAGFEDKIRVIQTDNTPRSPMPETLGRGEFTDESRIEREASRTHENGQSVSSPSSSTSPAITALNNMVRDKVASTIYGGSMSSPTSFSHQIELLIQLKQYLGDFQARLLGVSSNYQRKIDELHGAGMMDETANRYIENELAQTQALIARLVEHIGASDIPKVASEISFLEQKL